MTPGFSSKVWYSTNGSIHDQEQNFSVFLLVESPNNSLFCFVFFAFVREILLRVVPQETKMAIIQDYYLCYLIL